MIGKTISHYKILEELGRGGMGVVYKAQDTKLDRFVALKFLPPHVKPKDVETKRLIAEAKVVSSLDHPNICTVYEIGETPDGQLFIAMAFSEGTTLEEKIARGPLSSEEAVEITHQIAQALQATHEKGIVHRDIKSSNVIITDKGQVKLLDFGLAVRRGATRLTQVGNIVGTAHYMSPEQARGEQVDHQTDIWSLGVLLYEMLTCRLPFESAYWEASLYSILNEEPRLLATIRADVPSSLDQIIRKALQKDRRLRYQTMGELIDDLEKQRIAKKSSLSDKQAIAVLPFENISPDKENEYFSDGLTDEIIAVLSKIQSFKVISRTSIMRYKNERRPLKEIARELQVQHILEGTVRKQGNSVLITAQLIEAGQDTHLWAEKYRGTVEDVFDIQEKVARQIVDSLKVQLSSSEQQKLGRRYTENSEAYQLYLKGRYYWNKRSEEGFWKGIEFFKQAIDIDPTYGLAYTGLADCYALLGDVGVAAIPPKEAFSKARTAALKALEIDKDLAEAHTSLGHIWMHYFEWEDAEHEFRRAFELNPNYATTYHWYGPFLALMGRVNEAVQEIRRAQELDPLSLAIHTDVGVMLYYARRYDEAIDQYRKTLDMDPGFSRARVTLSSALGRKGLYEEALAELQKAIPDLNDRTRLTVLGRLYAATGREQEALEAIDELIRLSKDKYVSPYSIALIYANVGDYDHAFELLERSYEERAADIIFLKVDPWLENLHSDQRFTILLKKLRLMV